VGCGCKKPCNEMRFDLQLSCRHTAMLLRLICSSIVAKRAHMKKLAKAKGKAKAVKELHQQDQEVMELRAVLRTLVEAKVLGSMGKESLAFERAKKVDELMVMLLGHAGYSKEEIDDQES
jgi:hypothetical protein